LTSRRPQTPGLFAPRVVLLEEVDKLGLQTDRAQMRHKDAVLLSP
jgi:hypothetical protein